MTDIRFYHLNTKPLTQALPEILGRALAQGRRVVVKSASEDQAEMLNDSLWTWQENSFLPHGSKQDGFAAEQPVWLTAADENPNKADVLILTHGATSEMTGEFSLCCEMLDGRDEDAVTAARARWKIYKDQGHSLTYWQQNEKGGWDQKAA